MNTTNWLLTVTAVFSAAGTAVAANADKEPNAAPFGMYRTCDMQTAKTQALAWLKSAGKADEKTLKEFEAVWAKTDTPVLDLVTATLTLGDKEAARLLEEARTGLPPVAVPHLLQDAKQPVFYRSNLALAYAKALSTRRIYEESLDVLGKVKPEQVVDPASYFFHRGLAEYALMQKEDAQGSISRLLEEVVQVPDRYSQLAALMQADMKNWKSDLGEVARMMDIVQGRLGNYQAGDKTQQIEKDIIDRLDEMIKKLEEPPPPIEPNDEPAPPGVRPIRPLPVSRIRQESGPGEVDDIKLRNWAENWGKLPEKERARAMQDMIRQMPAQYREVIENYVRQSARVADR